MLSGARDGKTRQPPRTASPVSCLWRTSCFFAGGRGFEGRPMLATAEAGKKRARVGRARPQVRRWCGRGSAYPRPGQLGGDVRLAADSLLEDEWKVGKARLAPSQGSLNCGGGRRRFEGSDVNAPCWRHDSDPFSPATPADRSHDGGKLGSSWASSRLLASWSASLPRADEDCDDDHELH